VWALGEAGMTGRLTFESALAAQIGSDDGARQRLAIVRGELVPVLDA
jgi:hypothetical protein